MEKLRDTVRAKASKDAERQIGEERIAQEVAARTLLPEYESYTLRTDGMGQDVGVRNQIWERNWLENNIQVTGIGSHDQVSINNEAYSDLVIPKDTCFIELQVCSPSFVFNRSTLRAGDDRNANLKIPKVGSTLAKVIRTFTWRTLPKVVCHRCMWPLRAIYKRDLIWAGSALFDSTETGILEMCYNVANGLMGDAHDRVWWQERLPTPIHEPKSSKYSKVYHYAITADEFPGSVSSDFPYDFRMYGLKLQIPYYVCQANDLTYAGPYAQNRTQTIMTLFLGFVVGVYAFVSKNIDEVPFCEHDFVTSTNQSEFHIPKRDNTNLPGYPDRYLGMFIDTLKFSFYHPYNTRDNDVSILGGPTVIGFQTSETAIDELMHERGWANANGDTEASLVARRVNTFMLPGPVADVVDVYKAMINTKMGNVDPVMDYVLGPMKIMPFRSVDVTIDGYVPASPCKVAGGALEKLVDAWWFSSEGVDFLISSTRSSLIKGVASYGTGIFFHRPYLTAIASHSYPAALPYRFEGLDGNNASKHKLSFRMSTVMGDGGGVDQMRDIVIKSAGDAEGSLMPVKSLTGKCFMSRELVNLDTLAFNHMNMERDSTLGMLTSMWHSMDTNDGVFKLSPKETHTQIMLNGVNNTLTYDYYALHLTRYTRGNCKREHPLSFTDFDCIPVNQIFKELIFKWQSNNSAGEQLVWKYDNDPEMEIFYSYFVSYQKAFWPESAVPSREEWLIKPVIIFSPNTRHGRPVRKFSSFNTGSITVDCSYRDHLSYNDFFSLHGENYNFALDPVIEPPAGVITVVPVGANAAITNNFNTTNNYRDGIREDGTAATQGARAATTAERWLNPTVGRREIQGRHAVFDFSVLNQSMSGLCFRIIMTNTSTVWFAGVTSGGAVPCTVFVRAGGTGPAPTILKK